MKASTSVLALSAALGAVAMPSHGHGHVHAHARRDFVVADKPVVSTKVVAANAAPTASAKKITDSSKVASVKATSGEKIPFCSGSNSKRSTAAENAYGGNTGGSDFGCNLMTIDEDIADLYDYNAKFVNKAGKDVTCVCWNKNTPSGELTGFFKGNQVLNFDIPSDGSQYIAMDSGSIGGCSCGLGEVETTDYGAFKNTWVEFEVDSISEKNKGFSGADASILIACDAKWADFLALKLEIAGESTRGGKDFSYVKSQHAFDETSGWPLADEQDAYICGTEGHDGLGYNIGVGKQVHMTVTLGDFDL